MKKIEIPEKGIGRDEIMSELKGLKEGDASYSSGHLFSLIYNAGEEIMELGKDAYRLYITENGLSPFAFPSLKKMETETVAMCAALLGGDEKVVGSMTCGGTESIFMAVKTARDWARDKRSEVKAPEILIPASAHPAFVKAAHYLEMKVVHIPVGEDFRADVAAIKAAVNENTIMMAGSAMTYPQGMVDPIAELAAIAAENNIWFHVDSCLGGFILPYAKKLGYDIPEFDFSVAGVTSMSADIHKYAYAPKGASLVMYRNKEYRKYQYFAYADWAGGVYGTSTLAGARTGGAIAGAWATLRHIGIDGYLKLAKTAMETTKKLMDGVNAIDGLRVGGKPHATVFCIMGDGVNVYALSDEMHKRGWILEKQQLPPSLHMTVSPFHANVVDEFLKSLAEATDEVRGIDASKISGEAAMYGMMATMPDRKLAQDLAVQYLNDVYTLG